MSGEAFDASQSARLIFKRPTEEVQKVNMYQRILKIYSLGKALGL